MHLPRLKVRVLLGQILRKPGHLYFWCFSFGFLDSGKFYLVDWFCLLHGLGVTALINTFSKEWDGEKWARTDCLGYLGNSRDQDGFWLLLCVENRKGSLLLLSFFSLNKMVTMMNWFVNMKLWDYSVFLQTSCICVVSPEAKKRRLSVLPFKWCYYFSLPQRTSGGTSCSYGNHCQWRNRRERDSGKKIRIPWCYCILFNLWFRSEQQYVLAY